MHNVIKFHQILLCAIAVEAPAINGNHVIEESEVEKPPEVEVEIETLALEEKPTNEISIETNGPTNEIPIETNGISEDPKVYSNIGCKVSKGGIKKYMVLKVNSSIGVLSGAK